MLSHLGYTISWKLGLQQHLRPLWRQLQQQTTATDRGQVKWSACGLCNLPKPARQRQLRPRLQTVWERRMSKDNLKSIAVLRMVSGRCNCCSSITHTTIGAPTGHIALLAFFITIFLTPSIDSSLLLHCSSISNIRNGNSLFASPTQQYLQWSSNVCKSTVALSMPHSRESLLLEGR